MRWLGDTGKVPQRCFCTPRSALVIRPPLAVAGSLERQALVTEQGGRADRAGPETAPDPIDRLGRVDPRRVIGYIRGRDGRGGRVPRVPGVPRVEVEVQGE